MQAPDIVISDLEPKYKLSPDEFSLVERYSNYVGDEQGSLISAKFAKMCSVKGASRVSALTELLD